MKNQLDFRIPFTGFSKLDFISCFTSTYVFLENIPVRGGDGKCANSRGEGCNGCGNCETSNPLRDLEPYYFLFDTMSGRSSLRQCFDGEPSEMQKRVGETWEEDCGTDYTVDFLFGFVGYEYRKLTEQAVFRDEIISSIDEGKPVIVKVKSGEGRFRVITGYDGDKLICPNFVNAQKRPEKAPSYEELDVLYRVGVKIAPRYTLLDGLRRICEVMDYNIREKLLMEYVLHLGWYSNGIDGMGQTDGEGRKARMQRVSDTMWHIFNCHNFAEVFRKIRDDNTVYDKIGDMARLHTTEIKALCADIGGRCYGYTHDLAWALIGLNERTQDAWNSHYACGWSEMVEMVLGQIDRNDKDVFGAVNKMIEILESEK